MKRFEHWGVIVVLALGIVATGSAYFRILRQKDLQIRQRQERIEAQMREAIAFPTSDPPAPDGNPPRLRTRSEPVAPQ